MRNIENVLRLHARGLSTQRISLAAGVSKTSVIEYLRRAAAAGLSWPLPDGLDERALERLLFPPPASAKEREFTEPNWALVHRELKRPGVTLALLWDEYRGQHPSGYGYSAFCIHYRRWAERLSPVMRQRHAAGERMFVDYSGVRMTVTDPTTGVARPAEVFIAVMGASNMTYAEASWSQTLPDWIGAHTRAFAAFGAVPALVVSDNLKSAVIRACFYEPEINRSYAAMASHYGTAILPARPYKPRDKAKVEGAVLLVHVDVLILDDWGPDRLSTTQRRELMEIVEERYGRRSTIITSQLPVKAWHETIGEPTFADAILDRLVHNAYRLTLDGPSLRKSAPDSQAETGQ